MTDRDIAEILLSLKAVQVRMNPPFTWVSGIKSPVYCDNRLLISYPNERKQIILGFKNYVKDLDFDVIAGTATAGIPWAAFLAYELFKPMIYVRPEKKDHGAGKQIEGFLASDSRVLLVEDLISTGGSVLKSAQVIQTEGKSNVVSVLAIVTWELKEAKENFFNANLQFSTLTNFTNLIDLAKEKKMISDEEYEQILRFKDDPKGWEKIQNSKFKIQN